MASTSRTTTRQWPVKNYGGIPELDNDIKKGPFKGVGTDKKFKVDDNFYSNVTDARARVVEKLNLQSKYPIESLSKTVTVGPNGTNKSKRNNKSHHKKPAAQVAANETTMTAARSSSSPGSHAPSAPRLGPTSNGADPFPHRIFVRLPDQTEISFPENASQHMMETTLRLVRHK